MKRSFLLPFLFAVFLAPGYRSVQAQHPLNTWVKISPIEDGPPSPRLGYEGACVWDSRHHQLIRYGGHNQGGGGEQGSEIWTFDPGNATWQLHEPNISPPGVCCAQQNVFDPVRNRYIRFPSFSGSHGWQWFREIYLNDSSVWSWDPGTNRWSDRRPLPAPNPRPLRCASWDSDHEVIVLFGGEGSRDGTWVYEPFSNTWTEMNPEQQPPFRSGGNMTYAAGAKLHVLFGAQFSDDPHTWIYDLRQNRWSTLDCKLQPPTDKNDAVLTYDPHSDKVLAVIKVTEGEDENAKHRLETWTLDVASATWTKMNPPVEPDPSGDRARQLHFAPELNLAILENCPRPEEGKPREQQIWTYRLTDQEQTLARDLPVKDLEAAAGEQRVDLSWDPESHRGLTYEIERGTGDHSWKADFRSAGTVEAAAGRWIDESVRRETLYHYRLRVSNGRSTGSLVQSRPEIVEDVLAAVDNDKEVALHWKMSEAVDIAGYRVERARVNVLSNAQLKPISDPTPSLIEPSVGAIVRIGPFQNLHADLLPEAHFTDRSLDLTHLEDVGDDAVYAREFALEHRNLGGKPYRYAVFAYRVRAVNRLGVESGPSAPAFTLPPAPQHVFAREEGEHCHLRWEPANSRIRLHYRVYRMDGRWNKDPIQRLTPDPLAERTFVDTEAGRSTRRYYVVAVDRLGQEGFPSSPVWHYREWRNHYEPFVGEWHQ